MRIRTVATLISLATILALVSVWMAQQAYTWFPPQASLEAALIDRLFSFLVGLGTFIFLGVVGTLTYSMVFQQAAKYDAGDGPHIEGNVTLEVVWTAIPFALVIWIATYSYQIYDQMAIVGPMEHSHAEVHLASMATSSGASTPPPIQVRARQWAWEFYYPEQNITSAELHLPANQRAQLSLRSEDVLHGFYVPAFRVKQDIIPGRQIDFGFTPTLVGRYRLRDSQYSGTYFATMQTHVVVESPEAYQQWLVAAAAQPPMLTENPAYNEYQQAQSRKGWKTVVPAMPRPLNAPINVPLNASLNASLNAQVPSSANLAATDQLTADSWR
jgi:cytochrome c oxidase subunit II